MNYEFPEILHIDDVRKFIKDSPEFIVAERDGYIVINYVLARDNTFDCIVRRELRGIIFCNKTGKVISRRFHKFFNMNEREDTQSHIIDWNIPHIVLEKLDGSMITPLYFSESGCVRWATKMGVTDVALKCEDFVKQHSKYDYFARYCTDNHITPIFEYIAPNNRIVIKYNDENLILLAMRYNVSGKYLTRQEVLNLSKNFDIPVVSVYQGSLDDLKNNKDMEGVVVCFNNGHMIKIKTDWYVAIHKAKDKILFEKNVIKLILNEEIDDVLADLPENDKKALLEYKEELIASIDVIENDIRKLLYACHNKNYDKKYIALNIIPTIPEFWRPIVFKSYSDDTSIRQNIINYILNHTNSQTSVDNIRNVIGAVWNYGK